MRPSFLLAIPGKIRYNEGKEEMRCASMQKSAKFILPLLLTAALLIGFTGCADKNETPTNSTTEAATAESTAAPTTPVTLQAPVMKTEDWDAYAPTEYQNKEHLSVTLNLTADLTA